MKPQDKIEIIKMIRPYLGRIDAMTMPKSFKDMIMLQYEALDMLSNDKHDYGKVNSIMDLRFRAEVKIFIHILEKLTPELKPLISQLKKKTKNNWFNSLW